MATIRIVAQQCDVGNAAHCDGAKAILTLRTFDMECSAEFAEWMKNAGNEWCTRSVVGVEMLPDQP